MRERLDAFRPKRFPEIVMLELAQINIDIPREWDVRSDSWSLADTVVVGSCLVVSCIETGDTDD